jgi:hypothetical protein
MDTGPEYSVCAFSMRARVGPASTDDVGRQASPSKGCVFEWTCPAAGAAAYFIPAFRKSITVDHAGVYGTGFCTEQSAPEVERIVAAARTPSSVR